MKSLAELRQWGYEALSRNADSRVDADVLLCFALQCDKAYLMTWPEKMLPSVEQKHYESLIKRRQQGEPVAYIIGKKAFWDWEVLVTPETLIPRPETELLIEQTLSLLPITTCQIADIGTGSGVIACTLAKIRPNWQIVGIDSSAEALSVAGQNVHHQKLNNVQLQRGYYCDALKAHFYDAIISNPPYIPESDPHLAQGDLRFEPQSALVPGKTGLEAYEAMVPAGKKCLKDGGWLLFEHGFDQDQALADLLKYHGYSDIQTIEDLAGQPRVTVGKLKK